MPPLHYCVSTRTEQSLGFQQVRHQARQQAIGGLTEDVYTFNRELR
jgi:hypothetical protein